MLVCKPMVRVRAWLLLIAVAAFPCLVSATPFDDLVPGHPTYVSDGSLSTGWWLKLPTHINCPGPDIGPSGWVHFGYWQKEAQLDDVCKSYSTWHRSDCPEGQVISDENYACTEATPLSIATRNSKESGAPSCPATKHPIAFSSGNKYLQEVDEIAPLQSQTNFLGRETSLHRKPVRKEKLLRA